MNTEPEVETIPQVGKTPVAFDVVSEKSARDGARTTRYGARNYRNSIGADFRRHWRGTFVAKETVVNVGAVEEAEVAEVVPAAAVPVLDEPVTIDPTTMLGATADDAAPIEEAVTDGFFDTLKAGEEAQAAEEAVPAAEEVAQAAEEVAPYADDTVSTADEVVDNTADTDPIDTTSDE